MNLNPSRTTSIPSYMLIKCNFSFPFSVSRAKILGNSEIFVKSGSDINLTCVAMHSPVPPSFIYWYKEGRVINYSQRGGISVLTERKTRTSKLVIAKATPADSGNYTCTPSTSGEVHCLFSSYFCFGFWLSLYYIYERDISRFSIWCGCLLFKVYLE